MKRTLFLVLFLTALLGISGLWAEINLTDGDDLQAAVNSASLGEVINLANGTYTLSSTLYITQSLSIIGQSQSGVTIDISGSAGGYGFLIEASYVTLRNFTVIPNSTSGTYTLKTDPATLPAYYSNLELENITIAGSKKSAFDIHGYNNVTLTGLTATNTTGGVGVAISGCDGVTLTGITTSNNAWGGIAIYVSTLANRGTSNVTFDFANNSIGETYYIENEAGMTSTNVLPVGYSYGIYGSDTDPITDQMHFLDTTGTLAVASTIAQGLNTRYGNTGSYIWDSTGTKIVTPDISIQAAIDAATAGDVINIAAGTYSESLGGYRDFELFKSLSLIGAGSNQTIIELTNLQHGMEIRPDATGVVLIEGISFTKQDANEYAAGWPILVGETGGVFNSLTFRDVEVAYASGRNIHLANNSTVYHNVVIDDCNIHHSAVWGFSTAGTINAITVTNSDFEYNGSYGSSADPVHGNGFDLSGVLTQNVTVTGGSFSHNTKAGINMMQVQNATFTGVTANYNAGAPDGGFGIKLDEWGSGSSGIDFIDCTTNYNAYDGIIITPEGPDAIENVLVSGCTSIENGRNGVGLWYINTGSNNPSMSDITITMSKIYSNAGLEIEVGSWWVPTTITEPFYATYNWFGDTDPSDDVSAQVLYDPWYDSAAMDHLMSNAPVENIDLNTFYYTIQAAIDAANPGDEIQVSAGTYTENINIDKRLTITGAGSGTDDSSNTIIAPLSEGIPVVRITASGVSDTDRLTISNIRVTGGYGGSSTYENSGIKFENNYGSYTTFSNVSSVNNEGSGLLARAGTLEYVEILNCDFSNNGKMGFLASGSTLSITSLKITNSVMNDNVAGLYISGILNGLELTGGTYNYNHADEDPTNGVGIYIYGRTAPPVPTNPIVLSGFQADNNVRGVVINKFYGPVTISNASASNNSEEGIAVSPGTNVSDTITFSNITANNNAKWNLWVISYQGFTLSDVVIENCTLNNSDGYNDSDGYGLYLYAAANSVLNVNVTGCTISGNNLGIYEREITVGTLTADINSVYFSDNITHIEVPVGDEALLPDIAANNTYDHSFIIENYIFGNAAALYVGVPDEVIPDAFTQTYSMVASYVENMRGFTVQVEIPKADFVNEPANFDLADPFDSPIMINEYHDATNWIFEVSGAMLGGVSGVSGEDIVLFTFDATSTTGYSNVTVPGCDIVINYDSVILKDDQNPYNEIPCAGTVNGWVLIDNTDPSVVIDNSGDYLPVPYLIPYGSSGLEAPVFNLTYTDDWDLYSALYLIQGEGDTAPDYPTDFTEVVGAVDGTLTDIDDWEVPIDGLDDGTYTIYFLVTDEAGNFYILDWDFIIDTVAPTALDWVLCRTTPDADNSVDLEWSYAAETAPDYIHIWALDYAAITSIATNPYPEYDPTDLIVAGTIVNDIDPYTAGPSTLGWIKVAAIPVGTALTLDTTVWAGMERGYYYFTIYGVSENGQISDPPVEPFYRESISYWPGDVQEVDGSVGSTDIARLSAVWGLDDSDALWDNEIDVGPSTDFARRSRPMPDNVIDIEDLMMFAMNYMNTDYNWYPRTFPETEPVTITLGYESLDELLTVTLELGGNTGFLKGLDIPIAHGSGLQMQNVEMGPIWPEGSLLLHTDAEGVVTVSCATLGQDTIVEGNGLIATLTFAVTGSNTGLELRRMIARGWDNRSIEIVNNPTGNVDNEDVVNVIPESSYLGSSYPNPFRGSTTIEYGVKEAGSVRLSVFNSRGQLIRSLVNESKAAGTYQLSWDGRDDHGKPVSSGIYLFRMETRDSVNTQKAILLK